MEQRPLDAYRAGLDPASDAVVVALDTAIRSAAPDLEVAIKYRMLMYAVKGDWRHWVCAIDAKPRDGVALRFLYGVLLDDPQHRLRRGSSILMNWDFPRGEEVDQTAVSAYVAEAVGRYETFKSDAPRILATGRLGGAVRRSPTSGA